MDEIIIKVYFEGHNDGWAYYVYEGDSAYMACTEAVGGVCDGTIENALDMAVDEAKELFREKR